MFWNRKKESNENLVVKESIPAIISYLKDGILIFDRNNKLSLINPQAEKFFKVSAQKVIGKPILALNRLSRFHTLVSFLGGEIREVSKKEVRIEENLVLEVSTVSIMSKRKKISSLVILRDISHEKLVEQIKTEFVTLAAHQLRNPLSSLKWNIKMLLDGSFGEMTKEQKKALKKAYASNEKMIRLVNSLLNVAQIEEGKYLSNLDLYDIGDLVNSVLENYKKIIDEKKIEVQFQMPEKELPKVMLDKEKMTIAISNIVDNALRYVKLKGSVVISIKADKREIEFQIQDSGLGIPHNQQKKMFTKFFRATNVLKVNIRGIGLGLYISKNIIEAHGGKIWFESKQDKGSIFYFTIPVKEKFTEFMGKEFY